MKYLERKQKFLEVLSEYELEIDRSFDIPSGYWISKITFKYEKDTIKISTSHYEFFDLDYLIVEDNIMLNFGDIKSYTFEFEQLDKIKEGLQVIKNDAYECLKGE